MSGPGTGTSTAPTGQASFDEQLQAFVGRDSGPALVAPDPVNQAMIRHWVEAMGDENPVYVDEAAARAAGFPGVIAPPTMLQAWVMRGLKATLTAEAQRGTGRSGDTAHDQIMALLDSGGFTSVVATNCGQHYERPLLLGDDLRVVSTIEAVSPEKATGLGVGHFVTTRMVFSDQRDELVATMHFRILKFRPRPAPGPPPARPRRPRPALTQDNRFFFEGAKDHRLLIQKCSACGTLRHPPRPACGTCRSFDWEPFEASGRGTVFSFTVNHYPRVPAFDYPLVVALVELEEGTRLVANVDGITPETVAIGMPVVATFVEFDDDLTLPVFRPAEVPGETPGPGHDETRND